MIVLFLGLSACGPEGDQSEGESADDQTIGGLDGQIRDERQARPVQQGDLAERIEDARLASRVLIALADDDQLRRFPFDVDAIRGEVFVRGDLPTLDLYRRVESVASGVSGVRSVVNETVSDEVAPVRTPPQPGVADMPEIEVDAPEDVVAEPSRVQEPVARESPPSPEPSEVFHTVRSGESLWTIARQHNTSIAEIRRLNNMSSDNLRPGQRIRVR